MRFHSYVEKINESLDTISRFDRGIKQSFLCEAYDLPPRTTIAQIKQSVMSAGEWNENVKSWVGMLLKSAMDPTTAGPDGKPVKRLFADEAEIEAMLTTYQAMSGLENGYSATLKSLFGDGTKAGVDTKSVSSMMNMIRNNGNQPIVDPVYLQSIIANPTTMHAPPMPTNIDIIRRGEGNIGRCISFTPAQKIWVWYSHALISCTSVATAGTGRHSAFVGIYPKDGNELANLVQAIVNGNAGASSIATAKKSMNGNKIFTSNVLDPKWEPTGFGEEVEDEETGETRELEEAPKLLNIGSDQTNAALGLLKEMAKLDQGQAYLQNEKALKQFLQKDKQRFNNYWNDILNNGALMDWVAEKIGVDPNRVDAAMDDAINGGQLYEALLGGNPTDAATNATADFANSLAYRPVDGLLNRFKGLKSFNQMLVSGVEEEETLNYCINHYPPPGSGWKDSYLAPEIRMTDKTLPMADRLKTLDPRALAPNMSMQRSGGAAAKIG